MHDSGTVTVYDIKNEVWLPQFPVQGTGGGSAGIDAAANGFTFLLADFGDYMAARYRDRLSADTKAVSVRATIDLPLAQITSPTNHGTVGIDLGQVISVIGTAQATNFNRYMLEVGIGSNPSSWLLVTEGKTSVLNSVLGTWNLDGVTGGSNTLRLQVFDTQGNVGEARVTVNVVGPNLPPHTFVVGPGGEVITNDVATIYLSATDDSTPPENIEYSWNLKGQGWSAFTTNPVVDLVGIGSGTNTLLVRARDSAGFSDPTPAVMTFVGTVEHAPDTPANLYPFSDQTNAPLPATLIASSFSDADPASLFSRSQFHVRTDGGSFATPLWNSGELNPAANVVQVPTGTLAENRKYWWQARYRDDTGRWSAWSAETSFTTGGLPPPPRIANINLTGSTFSLSVSSVAGLSYVLEYKESLTDPLWKGVQTVAGTGNEITLTDSSATSRTRFYRVRVE